MVLIFGRGKAFWHNFQTKGCRATVTDTIAEAGALAGWAITRLVARMIRKCEFRLGLHPHPAVKCQKDRKMSLGNVIVNIYIWRVLLFTFQVSQTWPVTKGYLIPTPTCYQQRTLWVKRRSASPAGSQCSNTEQRFPTYLRKGTPVQLSGEGPGDTGSDDHRNWTRRWQKGKTSNLHLVKTPVTNPTSVCSSVSKCFAL